MTKEIEFFIDPSKQRSFHVWDSKTDSDPDNMYPRFYEVADTMLEIIQKNDFR